MNTYHIISNPVAGKNKKGKVLALVESIFEKVGAKFQTHFSKAERDATQIVKDLTANGEKEIIAVGGDGTLHEVLNGIQNPTECRLGLIPAGTGNDFAEHIGIPKNTAKAAEIILKGETKATDYLEVGGVRCMNVAGLGIDVDVLERCEKGKLKGKIKYLMSLIQSLFTFKGCKMELECDGVVQTREALIAAACNGSQFGGGIKICPNAKEADGKIEAVFVDNLGGVFKIIQAFMVLMKGKILEYPLTTHVLCDRLRFVPEKPCAVQLDGELYTGLDFDVKIRQGLQFYRP